MMETTTTVDADLHSDAGLLNRFCRHRDEVAFAGLVRRHGPMVLGVCYQLLRHDQDAQDAFQATFLVLATRAGKIRNEASLASWLYKVAYRTSMRIAKNRSRARVESIPEDVPIVDDPLTTIYFQSMQLALYEELSRIPSTYQGPIILCYLEGKTRQQAAEELNCSDASVKARLTRAKRLLRSRLSRRGIALSAAITSCGIGMTAAQAASPDLFVTTVAGCCANLSSTSFTFSTSVTDLVTKGNSMVSFPTAAKYWGFACLSGLAFLGLAWATDLSVAQDTVLPRVVQLRLDEPQVNSDGDAARIGPIDFESTRLVSDTTSHHWYIPTGNGNDPTSQKLEGEISYVEKKSAAYLMLRDAELQRAEIAEDAPSKLEAQARAKLHEAEADKLAAEVKLLKSKLPTRSIRVDWVDLTTELQNGSSPDPVPCCRDNNLAYARTVAASSQEEDMNNYAQLAVDGDLGTRWCADGDAVGEWIQVDLGSRKDVRKIRIHWEMMETKYAYKIETSKDGQAWIQAVDTSQDPQTDHMPEHDLNAKETQFIRITFLGCEDGFWSSIREIEVTDGELSAPPVEAWEEIRDDATDLGFTEWMMLLDA